MPLAYSLRTNSTRFAKYGFSNSSAMASFQLFSIFTFMGVVIWEIYTVGNCEPFILR